MHILITGGAGFLGRRLARSLLAQGTVETDGGTAEQRRLVLPELAELLEAVGAFRDAALLYRELLRPGLAA